MSRTPVPQRSFADLEFLRQGVQLDPILKAIAAFLDTHASLVDGVRRDLVQGLTKPTTGRNGVTAAQVLRSLILMRVKNWDYRELRERIADGYTLRQFTQFESQRVPKHDAFNRAFNRLTPATVEAINGAVIQAAVDLGLEDGTKLRVDTTVVETDIHHPTDNTLLWDSVRVITRLVRQLDDLLPAGVGPFTNRTRAARRRMQEIQRMTARERHTQQVPTYRALIRVAEQVVTADRGFFNEANLDACQTAGVTLTCIPQSGGTRSAEREALEKSRPFKHGQRFRAGIEGRISVLFRGRGMKRALVEGREHFELLIGAAVLANNLIVIATLLRRKPARRRRPAAA
jgi:hypothetical protein